MRRNWILGILAVALLLGTGTPAVADWNAGVAAFKAGDLNRAAAEFKAIVDAQPEWPGGHFMLGWTLLKQGNNGNAVTHLRKAYDLNPNDTNIQLRLGEAYVAAGRYSDAVAFLGKIDTASLPREAQGFLAQLLAVAYAKTGQDSSALVQFEKAARLNPEDAAVQKQYGTAAYNAGDTPAAVSALEKASRLDPDNGEIQSAYAQALNRLGRESRGDAKVSAYAKAARAAAKLAGANPSYENLMLLGETQLGAKQYDEAVSSFQKAAAKNSSDWLAHYYTGQAYTAKQQYRSAEAALKGALDKTGNAADQTKIWKQLGFVYEKQRNFSEALRAYERANDEAGATRVRENQEIVEFNQNVEAEAEEIRKMQAEQERIKKELQELPGGPPPLR